MRLIFFYFFGGGQKQKIELYKNVKGEAKKLTDTFVKFFAP